MPPSVDASVREACSKARWTTEKNARRDAAFEAYLALYHAGLVNDNLLPREVIDTEDDAELGEMEKRPNLVEVGQQINIWPHFAKQWQYAKELQENTVVVDCAGHRWIKVSMLLPATLPEISRFPLYWDSNHTLEIAIEQARWSPWMASTEVTKEATYLILQSVFGNRMNAKQHDFMTLFVPSLPHRTAKELRHWLHLHKGTTKVDHLNAEQLPEAHTMLDLSQIISYNDGLLRDLSQQRAPHIFLHSKLGVHKEHLDSNIQLPGQMSDVSHPLLAVKKFPKRSDFLHKTSNHKTQEQGSGIGGLLAETCEMDKLPWRMAVFASLAPSILHVIHKTMLVSI